MWHSRTLFSGGLASVRLRTGIDLRGPFQHRWFKVLWFYQSYIWDFYLEIRSDLDANMSSTKNIPGVEIVTEPYTIKINKCNEVDFKHLLPTVILIGSVVLVNMIQKTDWS